MVTIQSPDELMEDYCYKPSSVVSATTEGYVLDISVESIDFGLWATTRISTPLTFTITNSGFADVQVTNWNVLGPFELREPIPSVFVAGETYTVFVYFLPVEVGPAEGILAFDAQTAIGNHSITFLGTGADFNDPDIRGIALDGSVSLESFPVLEDQLDVLVNTDYPAALT